MAETEQENKVIELELTARYRESSEKGTVNITPYVVKNAYFATKKEEIIYEPVKGGEQKHTVVSGDNLTKIANKYKTTVAKIKQDNKLKSDTVKLNQVLTIKGVDTKKEKGKNITFTSLSEASVGDEIYTVIETKDLEGKTIKTKIHQGKEKVLADVDSAITVLYNKKETYEFEAVVGELANEKDVLNKEELKNLAVTNVTLSPKEEHLKKWNDAIKKQVNKKTYLFLYVEADVKEKVKYKGNNDNGAIDYEQRFGNEEGKWLEMTENKLPPWMEKAWKEYKDWSSKKWTEKKGDGLKRANSYIKKAGDSFKANEKAWCGCFVHWVLKETNSTNFSTVTNNPTSSQNYWEKSRYSGSTQISPSLNHPPYGVIAVLHKSGWSGHVGFLINFKEKGGKKYAYLLGGNQNNKVCIQEYKVYKDGSKVKYKTKKGTVYTLKGYVYPKEFKIDDNKKHKNDYKTKGYTIEDAISTR